MDAQGQAEHLKAYGIVFSALSHGQPANWLLNYRGGSFMIEDDGSTERLCKQRGVSCSSLNKKEFSNIEKEMAGGGNKYGVVKLQKVPKIAVYTPPTKKPWDDAVTLALSYAEIPFDKIYATEVLNAALGRYDWLHLHHEDFTGQFGKYWSQFSGTLWYERERMEMETLAHRNGFSKVSLMQLAVVKKMRDFVNAGGNLFAMCSATETLDIALAAQNTDIAHSVFDGDPPDPDFQQKLDYTQCFAFTGFRVNVDPGMYEHSNIDNLAARFVPEYADSFELKVFPAQPNPIPAMLSQNHTTLVKGFMGQTNVFVRERIKPGVLVLADYPPVAEDEESERSMFGLHNGEARYLHGDLGKGTWTFYSGHDPEDFQHMVDDPPTNLADHPNSAGYRLILNNVLLHTVPKDVVPTVAMDLTYTKLKEKPVAVADRSVPDAFNLYPSDEQLTVSVNHSYDIGAIKNNAKIERVIITDTLGKEMINRNFSSETVSIDIKDLTPGMYSVTVNGTLAGKLMKQ